MTPGLDVDQRELSLHFILLNSIGLLNRNASVYSEGSHFQPEFYTQGDTVKLFRMSFLEVVWRRR